MLKYGTIASVPQILLNYTVHNQSISQKNRNMMREKSLQIRKNFATTHDFTSTLKSSTKLLAAYKGTSYRDFRIIFFLLDLLELNRLTNKKYIITSFRIFATQIFMRNIKLILPFIEITRKKISRDKIKSPKFANLKGKNQ